MIDRGVKTVPLMGTLVTIHVVGHDAGAAETAARDAAIARAFDWFRQVEACCSRFDPSSELSRVGATAGIATPVSELLFRAVEFACALAAETDGAFDPTVGGRMAALGFDRHYRTGERTTRSATADDPASYRDIEVDADRRTITVARPLQLDLGAVAKGLAIDLAARELAPFVDYAIDAGGDSPAALAAVTRQTGALDRRHSAPARAGFARRHDPYERPRRLHVWRLRARHRRRRVASPAASCRRDQRLPRRRV